MAHAPLPVLGMRDLHLIYRAQLECEDFGSENGTFNQGFLLTLCLLSQLSLYLHDIFYRYAARIWRSTSW